jgi:hypothetical protein
MTAALTLQAPVPAQHDDNDGDEKSSAGAAILAASAVDEGSRQLIRDEDASVTHTDALDASVPPLLTRGGRFIKNWGGSCRRIGTDYGIRRCFRA